MREDQLSISHSQGYALPTTAAESFSLSEAARSRNGLAPDCAKKSTVMAGASGFESLLLIIDTSLPSFWAASHSKQCFSISSASSGNFIPQTPHLATPNESRPSSQSSTRFGVSQLLVRPRAEACDGDFSNSS